MRADTGLLVGVGHSSVSDGRWGVFDLTAFRGHRVAYARCRGVLGRPGHRSASPRNRASCRAHIMGLDIAQQSHQLGFGRGHPVGRARHPLDAEASHWN